MSCLLGIEAGTTRVKASLVDDEKGVLAGASLDCAIPSVSDARSEIDMEKYWRACCQCLRAVADQAGMSLKQVAAVSVASQGVTFVPVDARGRALGNAITLYDTRADREAREMRERFGDRAIYRVTGQPQISALYEAPKLMWIRRWEPRRFRSIWKVLLVHDYLVFRLTGRAAAVPSLLSSSLLFDLRRKQWWDPMLDYLGLPPSRLPEILDHAQPVETVCREAREQTGLSARTLVVAGALDQICGMTGVGNVAPGVISESTGTVLAVHTLSHRLFPRRDCGVLNFSHFQDGCYALIGICPTACSALDWLMDHWFEQRTAKARQAKSDALKLLQHLAAQVPPGSDGVTMLPYLAGSGAPMPNSLARGVLCGFGLHHGKAHFLRALMEAIACELRRNIEMFREIGLTIREIRSFGGGSRSDLWNQIKANVCGIPVVTSRCAEPGCLGAAILAGVGLQRFTTADEGYGRLASFNRPQLPDAVAVKAYEQVYQRYVHLAQHASRTWGL